MNKEKARFASFLKFREQSISVEKLEENYGFKLPPVYKSFISQFEEITGDVYLDKQNNSRVRSGDASKLKCSV